MPKYKYKYKYKFANKDGYISRTKNIFDLILEEGFRLTHASKFIYYEKCIFEHPCFSIQYEQHPPPIIELKDDGNKRTEKIKTKFKKKHGVEFDEEYLEEMVFKDDNKILNKFDIIDIEEDDEEIEYVNKIKYKCFKSVCGTYVIAHLIIIENDVDIVLFCQTWTVKNKQIENEIKSHKKYCDEIVKVFNEPHQTIINKE